MSLSITIGGVTMTGDAHYVVDDSITHASALRQWDTATFQVISKDGSLYLPDIGAPVVITVNGTVRFGGTIRRLKVDDIGSTVRRSTVECSSWEQLLTRRIVAGQVSYTDEYAGVIFADLLARFAVGDGITSSVSLNGPRISISFDFCTVRDAFDQIAALASDDTDTYLWDCTPTRVARFYKWGTFSAPWDIDENTTEALWTDSTIKKSSERDLEKYCNSVYPRLSQFITDAVTEKFNGNGSQTVFTVGKPISSTPRVVVYSGPADLVAQAPETFEMQGYTRDVSVLYPIGEEPTVTVDDVAQSVGLTDNPLYQWRWTPNNRRIEQTSTEETLAAGAVVVVTYSGYGSTSGTGTEQTVGIGGVDTGKQWYWNQGSADVSQDSGGTALAEGTCIEITYQGYEERTLPPVVNATEIAARASAESGTGIYAVVVPFDEPGTVTDANARAQAWLDRYSQIPYSVTYPTLEDDLRAGMAQTIYGASYLIESITMTQRCGTLIWTAKAAGGALLGDYKIKLRSIGKSVSAGASYSAAVSSSTSELISASHP